MIGAFVDVRVKINKSNTHLLLFQLIESSSSGNKFFMAQQQNKANSSRSEIQDVEG